MSNKHITYEMMLRGSLDLSPWFAVQDLGEHPRTLSSCIVTKKTSRMQALLTVFHGLTAISSTAFLMVGF